MTRVVTFLLAKNGLTLDGGNRAAFRLQCRRQVTLNPNVSTPHFNQRHIHTKGGGSVNEGSIRSIPIISESIKGPRIDGQSQILMHQEELDPLCVRGE